MFKLTFLFQRYFKKKAFFPVKNWINKTLICYWDIWSIYLFCSRIVMSKSLLLVKNVFPSCMHVSFWIVVLGPDRMGIYQMSRALGSSETVKKVNVVDQVGYWGEIEVWELAKTDGIKGLKSLPSSVKHNRFLRILHELRFIKWWFHLFRQEIEAMGRRDHVKDIFWDCVLTEIADGAIHRAWRKSMQDNDRMLCSTTEMMLFWDA